jgi:nitrate/nitrite-specific signal transduction histidine kinase
MLELKLTCDTAEDARIYLNAHQYHNLLDDLRNALRNARKHGTDEDVVRVVLNFLPDITTACDHHTGPY